MPMHAFMQKNSLVSDLEHLMLPARPSNKQAVIKAHRFEIGYRKSTVIDISALAAAFATAVLKSCENSKIAQNGDYGVFAVFSRIIPEVINRIVCLSHNDN